MREINTRGWLADVYDCVGQIEKDVFTLDDVYAFENNLSKKHPANNYVRDKIRQQLQVLRDERIIEFLGNGTYRKL